MKKNSKPLKSEIEDSTKSNAFASAILVHVEKFTLRTLRLNVFLSSSNSLNTISSIFFSLFLWKLHRVKLLDQISKYIQLDPITEEFFHTETQTKTFAKGELLSHQNTYNRNVYYMEEGLARTYYFEKGKDITTNFYSEGKSFGSIDTIFSNVPSIYNIETLEESTITFCDYKKLEELCSVSLTSANFSRFLLGNLMTQMSKRVNSLQHMTAKEKYVQLLEENPNIILRAPLGMIATYLGISQETLSRIRSEI